MSKVEARLSKFAETAADPHNFLMDTIAKAITKASKKDYELEVGKETKEHPGSRLEKRIKVRRVKDGREYNSEYKLTLAIVAGGPGKPVK